MSTRVFPVRYDIEAYAGDAYSQTFGLRDTTGAYLDTAGWSGRMMVKDEKGDTTALLGTDPVVNEVQTVTITGAPTGGTFTLTYSGQTTAAIAYNATAANVQAALAALTNIGAANVAVTGGPLPGTAVTVTFQGSLGGRNVPQMTGSAAGLTGAVGATFAVTVATTTEGAYGDILITTGIQGTAPDQYNLEVSIAADRMARASLRGLVGWYDLEVTDASGRPTTLLHGQFLVESDVTR